MAEFKDNFKSLRMQRGISQRELAKDLNLAYSLVGMYETGKRSPSRETLKQICEYFGVDIGWILGMETTKESELIKAYHDADDGIKRAVDKLLNLG